MPTIPSSDTVQRQTPQNRRGFTQLGTPPDEQAGVNLGRSISNAGSMIAEANDFRSSVQAEDAMNQLAMADVELNAKLSTIKGGDAANQDLMGNFTKEREAKINEIKAGMKNSQAIGKFDGGVAKSAARFGATVLQHQLREAEDYRVMVDKAGIEASSATIGQNFNNEAFVNETLDDMRKKTAQVADMNGITDPVARTVFAQSRLGQAHLAFVDSAIDGGDSIAAERHLALYKAEMTSQQIDLAEKRIKPAADWDRGKGYVETYNALLLSGKTKQEAGKIIRDSADKDSYEAFKGIISDDENRQRVQGQETKGGLIERFVKSMSYNTMNAIEVSAEFNKMPSDDRGALSDFMRIRLQQASDRSETKKAENSAAYTKYIDALDEMYAPDKPIMSRNQINSLRPEIGNQLTNKLLAEHKSLTSGAVRFQIDKDILNEAIPGNLRGEPLRSFRGVVESSLVDWKTAHPGKIPSPEEQQRIASSANETWKDISGWNSNEARYKVKPGDKAAPKEVFDLLTDSGASDEVAVGFYAHAAEQGRLRGVQYSPQQILDFYKKSLVRK